MRQIKGYVVDMNSLSEILKLTGKEARNEGST